jgi:hypothetical protein
VVGDPGQHANAANKQQQKNNFLNSELQAGLVGQFHRELKAIYRRGAEALRKTIFYYFAPVAQ